MAARPKQASVIFVLCKTAVLVELGVMFGPVAGIAEPLDMDHFADPPALARAFDGNDEIDGLADHLLHGLLARFGGQLLQPAQGRHRRVRVDGGDAARVTGIPCLEQCQCGAIADLADDDAVRSETHRALQEPCHVDRVGGVQGHSVFRRALDFGGVFQDDHAILRRRCDDLGDDGICKRRLAGPGTAGNDDVHAGGDRAAQKGNHLVLRVAMCRFASGDSTESAV